jgi:hypothetical protein
MGAFVALPVAALISAAISNYAASYDVVYRSTYEDGTPHEDDTPATSGRATTDT